MQTQTFDLADVRGQALAKRALTVAAAGHHSVLFVGPPGCGKTMLAQRLTTILPPSTEDERRDLTMIWGDMLGDRSGFALPDHPFRAPHHTVSDAGLLGSVCTVRFDMRDRKLPKPVRFVRPGEVSLAHGGVLLLDELPEFRRSTLEALAHVMRDGCVCFAPDGEHVSLPARPIIVGAMNPCPCGWAGSERNVCRCGPTTIQRYQARIEALLPLFPIRVVLGSLPLSIVGRSDGPTSAEALLHVERARTFSVRTKGSVGLPIDTGRLVRGPLAPDVVAVARTIADLEACPTIERRHLLEAMDLGWWFTSNHGLNLDLI